MKKIIISFLIVLSACSKSNKIYSEIKDNIKIIDNNITKIDTSINKAKEEPTKENIEIIETELNKLKINYSDLKSSIKQYNLQCKIEINDYKNRFYYCFSILIVLIYFIIKRR